MSTDLSSSFIIKISFIYRININFKIYHSNFKIKWARIRIFSLFTFTYETCLEPEFAVGEGIPQDRKNKRKQDRGNARYIEIEISLKPEVEWSSLANITGSNPTVESRWNGGKGCTREGSTLHLTEGGTGATAVSASATNARRTRGH